MKGLLAILGKGKGAASEDDAPESESSSSGGGMKSSYRKEAMSAAKDGDLEALAEALMGFAECCSEGEG